MAMELGYEDLSKASKVVAVVVILLFLIAFTSGLELKATDSIKTYDSKTQKVTLINKTDLTKNVATLKLNTPINYQVGYGGVFKVAEFEVNSYSDVESALKQIEFYNLNKNMEKIERSYEYKVKNYQNVIIDDYEEVCIDNKDIKNITKICSYEIIGNHIEQKEIWIPLEKIDFSKGEVKTIGIFTYVYKGDKVEWIPTYYGVEIKEWASWVASLDTNLEAFYKLEETTGTSAYEEVNTQNLANTGVTINQTGIINKSYYFGDNSDKLNRTTITGLPKTPSQARSYGVWVYRTDSGNSYNNNIIALPEKSSGEFGISLGTNSSNHVVFMICKYGTACVQAVDNSILPLNTWTYLTATYDGTTGTNGMKLYINGVNVANQTLSLTGMTNSTGDNVLGYYGFGGTSSFIGRIDEVGIWSRELTQEEVINLYNSGLGCTYQSCTVAFPTIIINSPINYYNTTNPIITFNISVYDDFKIQNVSLYIDGVLNETNTSEFNGTYIFTKILTEDEHYWSILAYNNNSNPTQTADRYFTIDYTNPIINIYYPLNATYINTSLVKVNNYSTNFTWTVSDANLHTCIWYNGTTNNTITCNTNATINLPFGTYTFIAYANDSVGLTASSSVTATYGYYLFENAVNYTRYTTEASEEMFNFTFNKTPIYTISSIDLVYNGTNYGITDYSSTSNYQTISKTLQVPSVTADANPTFYFSVLFSDGTRVNSTTYTQQVNNTFLAVCNATYTNKIFNFTLVDEATQTNLSDGSIEASISLYSTDKGTLINSFSTYINNTNNLQICLSEATTQPNYLIDGVVKYNDLTHATEYYNFVNYTYTNATIGTIIMLYDLLTADSTEFQINFRDENYVPLENVLIYVNREYISENTFKTVELPKTDSQGQTIVHLVRNDVNYNLYAVQNGVILATFNNLRAYCEDYTIGNCKLYLTASSTSPSSYNVSEDYGISYSLAYSNSSNLISFNFVSSDLSTSKTVNLVVWRNTFMGNSSYCDTSLSSISGTLTCNTTNIKDSDAVVRVVVYVNGEQLLEEYVDLVDKGTDKDYYFLFFIFLIAFIFMFIESKTTVIIGVILGFGSAFALGLVKGKMFGFGSAGIFLIIIAIIMIWKLNKEKQQ